MPRSVPEWIAKHDDEAVPPRVRLRIWRRQEKNEKGEVLCGISRQPIRSTDKKHLHHKLALCLNGQHRESNLVWVLAVFNLQEAKREVAERASGDRKTRRDIGIRKRVGPQPRIRSPPMVTTPRAAQRAKREPKTYPERYMPPGFVSASEG